MRGRKDRQLKILSYQEHGRSGGRRCIESRGGGEGPECVAEKEDHKKTKEEAKGGK
jgi:hypothetical protein